MRNLCAMVVGLALGIWASIRVEAVLVAAAEWPLLLASEPDTARYVLLLYRLPFPLASAIAAAAALRFLRIHGLKESAKRNVKLPHFPFEAGRTQLVIGEVHNQDGT